MPYRPAPRIRPLLLAACAGLLLLAGAARSQAPAPSGGDPAIAPGDDFYGYVNGAWLRTTEIDADRSSAGVWNDLADRTDHQIADLLSALSRADRPDADARKVRDFYETVLDEPGIEARGLAGLRPLFSAVDAITSRRSLARYLGGEVRADVDVLNNTKTYTDHLFGLWVAQDLDHPDTYSAFLLQGGLGMPDRDYYLSDSPRMVALRAEYLRHIEAMLALAGIDRAHDRAARILALEVRIARAHASRLETEDVKKGDNHWAASDFPRRAPGMDWDAFFAGMGLHGAPLVVWQPEAVGGLSALVASEPLEDWKDYLRLRMLDHYGRVLPRAFEQERFAFHGTALSGIPQMRPRWKRALAETDAALGEALGRLYVERYFPPASKARIEGMVRQLIAAFDARLARLAWMDPATRSEAHAKLASLQVGVGYPDHWRDYSGLQVVRGDAVGNQRRAELFELHRNLAKLGRPIDRGEWVMHPQLVNAVNLPVMNAIQFPAAILQPPFFGGDNTLAMDYGAIGATIGHEISHSFDDQGALFDAKGRLHNWWTPADFDHFHASAEALAHQYDAYHPYPDMALNGHQVLSENIADLAGLSVALDAFHRALAERAAVAKDAGGDPSPDADREFFTSYGRSWRDQQREAEGRRRVVTDGHAPGRFRAYTVRNLDAWTAAFDVQPGQALYLAPAERVRIW